MAHKNERVRFEIKIIKFRMLAYRTQDNLTKTRIERLIAETEQKLREIDE